MSYKHEDLFEGMTNHTNPEEEVGQEEERKMRRRTLPEFLVSIEEKRREKRRERGREREREASKQRD